MIGLPYGEKNCDDMLSCFHLIPERNGQTDGRTDRFAISISRVSMLTRNNKCAVFETQCSFYCGCCAQRSACSQRPQSGREFTPRRSAASTRTSIIYRALAYSRAILSNSVRPSVCPSHSGIL